jgi:hypothetical protein
MGNTTHEVILLREKLLTGEFLGPALATTGYILDGVLPFIPPVSRGIKTPAQGRKTVQEQVTAGVDQIKIYSGLERDVFLAIADETEKHGLKLVGHVPESVYIGEAASSGQKVVSTCSVLAR